LNSVISNNKKQEKQIAVSKKVKVRMNTTNSKTKQIFVCYKILIIININTLFQGKKIRLNSTRNCCIAEKVLSFVAPSGEQELTKNYYKVNTVSFVAFCSLYVSKIIKFCRLIVSITSKKVKGCEWSFNWATLYSR